MPQREGVPPRVPCWVDSARPDPQAAAGFHGGLFGWEFEDAAPPYDAPPVRAAVLRGPQGAVFSVSGTTRASPRNSLARRVRLARCG